MTPSTTAPLSPPLIPLEPPLPKRRPYTAQLPFLEFLEISQLFAVIHSPRDRAIFRVAYHGGLRASEIGRIEMRDYDAAADRIMIHRLKGSRSGFHHLCREESRALRAWLKIRGTAPGPMFPSAERSPISRQMLDVLIKKYGAAAGIPKALRHFHILKHSCCTHLLAQGFHPDQVQDWVGHADIRNTMRYAHTTNARRGEMAAQLKDRWR